MKRIALALAILGLGLAAAPSLAGAQQLRFDVKRTKLDNGLRVVTLVDHTSPTVAVDVVYDVGSRNEERGRSGFAHLFEHMMFQGSKNVPRGEHFKLVSGHGGTLNGTTNEDPKWKDHAHHWLILHGRYTCKAQRPLCPQCAVIDLCAYKAKTTVVEPQKKGR